MGRKIPNATKWLKIPNSLSIALKQCCTSQACVCYHLYNIPAFAQQKEIGLGNTDRFARTGQPELCEQPHSLGHLVVVGTGKSPPRPPVMVVGHTHGDQCEENTSQCPHVLALHHSCPCKIP
ncbi:hypothetical protein DUNSADRAFT_16548 [Dunaliella salina]|uniref:Encoded protein n=1 Tax=Dunaliella salina TaxID=3046 RepID=A0ABQ7G3B3_DUNSA|nr:hypothetical protein DUNSADRAFT_16548 [Dunaliella salina]|eukprot:KAF5829096.1 hypothetical protein DUNSADRAFT_16548 [Dunaliella salina]